MMNNLVSMSQSRMSEFSAKQIELIRRTVAADLNHDEFDMFISIAQMNGLNPFKKAIYALVYNKDDANKRKVSFITGIGGYRSVAARSGGYRPDEQAPRIFTEESLVDPDSNPEGISHAEVTVHRYGPDGRWYPITGRAYWSEYAPIKDDADDFEWIDTGEVWADSGKPKRRKVKKADATGKRVLDTSGQWGKMPRVMLAKCAEADALRKGWPEDLGALYVDAEMDRATIIDMTATEIVDQERSAKRQAALGGPEMITAMFEFTEGLQAIHADKFADRCAEWLESLTTEYDVTGWRDSNRIALQQFWSKRPTDALELKKLIEKRITELQKEKATA